MSKPVSTQELFDMWQKMVNPSAYPLQTFMFPALDPKEVEKKIVELDVVEHWLRGNLATLALAKQSLQYQLAMLKGGEKFQAELTSGGKGAPSAEETANPALWAWNVMAEAAKAGVPAPIQQKPPAKKKKKR